MPSGLVTWRGRSGLGKKPCVSRDIGTTHYVMCAFQHLGSVAATVERAIDEALLPIL